MVASASLRIACGFELVTNPSGSACETQSQIHVNAQASATFVEGCVLEACVAWDENFVLFATDGFDYEDFLNIHLLDAQLNILDSASIGMPYASGSLGHLTLQAPDALHFCFPSQVAWRLSLFHSPHWRVPLLSEPAGVWRRFSLKRHFSLERLPDESVS